MVLEIAILDAGAQYTKLIDRRIRELNVETIILPLNTSVSDLKDLKVKGVVISGGPNSVNDLGAPTCNINLFQSDIPIFGICYGMQLMVKFFGGSIETKSDFREDGQYQIEISNFSQLYSEMDPQQMVLLTHGDSCINITDPLQVDILSPEGIVYGVSHKTKPFFGVQFHPEVDLSINGAEFFKNFLFKICRCEAKFDLSTRFELELEKIKNFVMNYLDYNILVLVSGGVDSSVASVMIQRAIDNAIANKEISKQPNIYFLHIDHGFMRFNESNLVKTALENIGVNVIVLNCQDEFADAYTDVKVVLKKNVESESYTLQDDEDFDQTESVRVLKVGPLKDAINPEHKRKIIGDTFIDIVTKFMDSNNIDRKKTIIVQGTLRPDLIESASDTVSAVADVIKTHHNDTEKVRTLRNMGLIFEPLKDFHKDEVHRLGEQLLGLPRSVVRRHPFPGPGLAIRMLCNKKVEKLNQPNQVSNFSSVLFNLVNYQRIRDEKIRNLFVATITEKFLPNQLDDMYKFTSELPMIYCNVLPIWSVGVQGDGRSYKNPIALSVDDIDQLDWPQLFNMVKCLLRMTTKLNRVIVSLSGKLEENMVNRKSFVNLTPPYIEILRKADHIVTTILNETDNYKCVDQFPVILLPLQFTKLTDFEVNNAMQVSIVLRPFISNDFMTGLPALPNVNIPFNVFKQMEETIRAEIPLVSKVFIDITGKPPGTTEWE